MALWEHCTLDPTHRSWPAMWEHCTLDQDQCLCQLYGNIALMPGTRMVAGWLCGNTARSIHLNALHQPCGSIARSTKISAFVSHMGRLHRWTEHSWLLDGAEG